MVGRLAEASSSNKLHKSREMVCWSTLKSPRRISKISKGIELNESDLEFQVSVGKLSVQAKYMPYSPHVANMEP